MTGNIILNIAIYILLNIFIFCTWNIVFKKFSSFELGERIAGAFLLTITQIIISELILGIIVQRLYPLELLIFNVLISGGLLFILKINPLNIVAGRKGDTTISMWKRLLQGFSHSQRQSWFKPENILPVLISVLTLLVICNLLILIFVYGPTSWDDYHYHLGFVNDIIQSGQIRYFNYTHSYTISFPHNIELLNLWNVIFFRNDGGVEVTNLFFLIFSSLIIYLTCRKFNASKRLSLIGGLLVFYIPMNLLLVKTTKVDVDLAALFIAAMYFLITFNFENVKSGTNKVRIILSAICLGIIFGSKSSGIYYIAAYLITVSALAIHSYKPRTFRNILKFLFANYLAIFLGCLVIGSFWYFRSWIIFQNPLYPLDLKVLGMHFPGEWQTLDFTDGLPQIQKRGYLQRLLYVWREKEAWFGVFYLADGKLGGFGSLWYILLLPSIIFTAIYSVIKKNFKLLILISGICLCFAIIPGNWVPHYTTVITLLGCITFIIFFHHNIKSLFLKIIFSVLLIFLIGMNIMLTVNGGIFDFKETLKRLTTDQTTSEPHTQQFADSNVIVNKILDNGDTLVLGSSTYFPYALVKDNFESKEVLILYKDENYWLENLQKVNPRLVMTLQDTPEYKTAINHPELFDKILVENVGPHILYAYLGNSKNQSIKEKMLINKTYENDLTKPVSFKEVKVIQKYGINTLDVDFYVNQPEQLVKPRIFLHLTKKDSKEFINLDYDPVKVTTDEIDGDTVISSQYGDQYELDFGIIDKNAYILDKVDINE